MNKIIQREAVESLLSKLIQIPSSYFEEEAIMKYVKEWLCSNGVKAEIHNYYEDKVTKFHGSNVIGSLDSGIPGPVIYLNGHLDSVQLCNGWTVPPYEGIIKDGQMYGLGALDMKCGCCAIMMVVAAFAKNIKSFKGNIVFHLVSDEEGPFGLGTTFLINDKKIEKADIAIITEPSAGFAKTKHPSISLGARGGYNYTIKVFGKSAHAAAPEDGINALVEASKIVCQLEKIQMKTDDKLVGGSNCIINMTGGGVACSVPDYAEIEVFRHIVRGENQNTIEEEVKSAIEAAQIKGSYTFEFRKSPAHGFDGGFTPYTTPEDNEYVLSLSQSIEKVCGEKPSITYFRSIGDFNNIGGKLGIPTIIFGPDGKNYHSYDECVNIQSTVETAQSIYDFLVNTLADNKN